MTQINLRTKEKFTDSENKGMAAGGRRAGRGSQGVWDGRVRIAVLNTENQQGPPTAEGTLPNVTRQPGCERSLGENGHMCTDG